MGMSFCRVISDSKLYGVAQINGFFQSFVNTQEEQKRRRKKDLLGEISNVWLGFKSPTLRLQ
jgi:hypothetical protein